MGAASDMVITALRQELAAMTYGCQVNNSVINAQKRELKAAEQRNADLEFAIKAALGELFPSDTPTACRYLEDALKTTESGADNG